MVYYIAMQQTKNQLFANMKIQTYRTYMLYEKEGEEIGYGYLMRPMNFCLIWEYKQDCITYTKNSRKILLFLQDTLSMCLKWVFFRVFTSFSGEKCLYCEVLSDTLTVCRIFFRNVIQQVQQSQKRHCCIKTTINHIKILKKLQGHNVTPF